MKIKEMKKTILLTLIVVSIILSINYVSATYCCEKTIANPSTGAGGYCQQTEDINDCDSSFGRAQTTCDQTQYCRVGTCIDNNAGECTQTGESLCLSQAGRSWVDSLLQSQDEIVACREGCCIAGDTVSFGTQAHCNQVASYYSNSNPSFRLDLDATECFALDLKTQKGACVREVNFRKECSIETKEDCTDINGAVFYSGLLCTAPGAVPGTSISDAVKPATPGTTCSDDGRVYFTDSKGNLANVFDESKDGIDGDDSDEVTNYWTYIQEPECEVVLDEETGRPLDSSCGACPYRIATACSKYSATPSSLRPLQAPQTPYNTGSSVCRAMSCSFDNDGNGENEVYSHGESWCYASQGTYNHIPNIIDKEIRLNTDIESTNYNLPGSTYYKLKCMYGEVMNESCDLSSEGARNKVCSESYVETDGDPNTLSAATDFSVAVCRANAWYSCTNISNSIDCENPELDCKWLHGYTFDVTERKEGFLGNSYPDKSSYGWQINEDGDYVSFGTADQQGSCVPLFAPGFEFWNPDSEDALYCAAGAVTEGAIYETPLTEPRDSFEDQPITYASHRCLENCYIIPGYGTFMNTSADAELTQEQIDAQIVGGIYTNAQAQRSLTMAYANSHNISLRQGQYCEALNLGEETGIVDDKATTFDTRAIGPINAFPPACTSNQNRIIEPLFYTNMQWLNFVTQRAHSLGDCGYKTNAVGTPGQTSAEIITVIFQKLNQDLTVVEDEEGTTETIWNPVDGFDFSEWRGPPMPEEETEE